MKQARTARHGSWIKWYFTNGRNAAATCRHFSISRSTFYRWRRRFLDEGPKGLRRSQIKKKPTWSSHHLARVSEIAMHYPRWGRGRMQVELAGLGWSVSEATVGRMLKIINNHCPVCRGKQGKHNEMVHVFAKDLGPGGLDVMPMRSGRRLKKGSEGA